MKQAFGKDFARMTTSQLLAWTDSGTLAPSPIIIIVGIGLHHHESTANTE